MQSIKQKWLSSYSPGGSLISELDLFLDSIFNRLWPRLAQLTGTECSPSWTHIFSKGRWLSESHRTWPNRDGTTRVIWGFSEWGNDSLDSKFPKSVIPSLKPQSITSLFYPSNFFICHLGWPHCLNNKIVEDSKTGMSLTNFFSAPDPSTQKYLLKIYGLHILAVL